MSETLTMDEAQAEQPELTPEEQDSLQVGEQLQNQQENLLAGKYKNAEELEKAHLELQKKLGERAEPQEPVAEEPKAEEPVEEEPKAEDTKDEKSDPKVLDELWNQREKGFSDEALQKLAKTNPGELAKEYLRYRETQQPKGLSDKDVTDLKNIAGGPEKYDQLVNWATKNLPEKEQQMYDAVVDRGDPLACYFALQTVMNKYENAVGVEGQLITGKAPSANTDTFRSQAELVAAMGDPRYDNDPAYRQDVISKLDRSKINF
tara:strand:- start:1763 stop:2548 length:786 start_codon:yes stop_codon:yes gene_type:complete